MSQEIQLKSTFSSKRFRRSFWMVTLVGFLMFAGLQAFAQLTTADIIGTVRDASGAVVPNAKVTLQRIETHQDATTTSDSAGNYTFTFLVPGHYSVRVEATGFKTVTIPNLAVSAGDRARADAALPVGQASETIEVVAQTPLLQTDNATVSSTIDNTAVQDLPLNGRNFVQLVQLAPGANEGPGNGLTSGNRPDDRRSTNGLSVNGFDDVLNNELIDGIDNNERIIGTIGVKPSIESIQEVNVETNNYSPEIGRTAGGVINVITKSGTNAFHGSAYEYLRNDKFDSKFVTSTVGAKPELRQNQYGGSIGGPIRKDKTFFFFDYEGSRNVQGKTYQSTVPTQAQYNDIQTNNGLGLLAQAVATGNLPAGLKVDPIALNYLKMYPAPNAPGITNNYVTNPRRTQYGSTYDARVDQKFDANNNLYARWTYNDVATYTPAALANVVNGLIAGGGRWNFSGPSTGKANQLAAYFTHVFTTNTLLQLRVAGTNIDLYSQPTNNGTNGDTKMGWGPNMDYSSTISGLTPIYMGAFPDIGDGQYVPLRDVDNTFQYDGTVSYHHANHDIKYGASLIRRQARNIQSAAPYGTYSFGLGTDSYIFNDANGVALATPASATDAQHKVSNLASILVGAYTDHSRNVDITPPDYRAWEPSFFVQDTFKATRKLTVVYGLRYDYFAPFTEAHNGIANFDYTTAAAIGTTAAVNNAWQVAGVNGVSASAGIKSDYKNFAPRLGFTYEIANGMVLRGGFGMSYFPGNYTSNSDLKNAPFVSVYSPNCASPLANGIVSGLIPKLPTGTVTINAACTDAFATFDAGLPAPVAQTINSPNLSFIAEDPNLKMGVAKQFNLSLQKSFGPNVITAGYVGVRGSHLPDVLNDINLPAPNNDKTTLRPLATLLPNLSSVGWYGSAGKSTYDGLQTSFQRRLSSGLTASLNYTWAHALDNVVGLSEEGDQGYGNASPANITAVEYGNADNDIRHRFAATVTYALPFGKGLQGAKKMLLGGWQTNAIMAWQTGHAFTVENNGADGGTGNRALPYYSNVGADRPNMFPIGTNVTAPAGASCQNAFGYMFCPQALGTVGNEQRNALHGPGFHHVDLSLFKEFALRERVKLQFRAEAYNFTNTPSWTVNNQNNGNELLGTGNFGKVTDADPNYTPREFQFALKLTF